jgi:hypothetical protein
MPENTPSPDNLNASEALNDLSNVVFDCTLDQLDIVISTIEPRSFFGRIDQVRRIPIPDNPHQIHYELVYFGVGVIGCVTLRRMLKGARISSYLVNFEPDQVDEFAKVSSTTQFFFNASRELRDLSMRFNEEKSADGRRRLLVDFSRKFKEPDIAKLAELLAGKFRVISAGGYEWPSDASNQRRPGRPRLRTDEWAREQVHNLGRNRDEVFNEWNERNKKDGRILADREDSFSKVLTAERRTQRKKRK